jgi:hypothetical protein
MNPPVENNFFVIHTYKYAAKLTDGGRSGLLTSRVLFLYTWKYRFKEIVMNSILVWFFAIARLPARMIAAEAPLLRPRCCRAHIAGSSE